MPDNNLRAQVYKSRKRGRPKIRWLDDMLDDLRRMDVRGYTKVVMDMRHWRCFTYKHPMLIHSKIHKGSTDTTARLPTAGG